MAGSVIIFFFLVFCCSIFTVRGKYVEGEINTQSDWEFITRFCFLSNKGTLKFEFEYPVEYAPQNVLLYYDTPDQWDSVYGTDKTCAQKVSVLKPENNQIIYLTTAYGGSGCTIKTIEGVLKYVCVGGRTFKSARERWWFVAVSRCDKNSLTDTCEEREAVLNPDNNQIIYLQTTYGCKLNKVDGQHFVNCNGVREFRSARERWWFIAASRCSQPNDRPDGLRLKYKIHMTNGQVGDYLHREYSADEFYILPIDITFLILYAILCVIVIICAVQLRNRQLWHTTYKLYMVSIFLTTFGLFLLSLGYGVYGNDGLGDKLMSMKYAGRAFESLSTIIFLLMLILMGKGYTITRGKLSAISTIKITVFFTLYTIAYIVMFIWEGIFFDPGLVLYVYESPPGYGLIAMRLIGWIWFCYAIFFTLKHYPEKGSFYYPFFVFYTLWFWAGPIVIVVAMYAIALWSREKTVVGVENFVALCGHIFFLVLTRPAAANSNFPYHVRTTQIGITQNAPHTMQEGVPDDNENFGQHAYSISRPVAGSSNGPDLTGLFVTSKTFSEKRSPEPPLNNNEPKGDLPPSYSSVEYTRENQAPSAPPQYEVLFQVNGGYTGDQTS